MKVDDKRTKSVPFSGINYGEAFQYEDKFYIKVNDGNYLGGDDCRSSNCDLNVMGMDGVLSWVCDTDMVESLKSKLEIW